jgi:hypothetical protein
MSNTVPSITQNTQQTYAQIALNATKPQSPDTSKTQKIAQQHFNKSCTTIPTNNLAMRLKEMRKNDRFPFSDKPNRQQERDFKMELLGVNLNPQDEESTFVEQVRETLKNYETSLKLLDSSYCNLRKIYNTHETFKNISLSDNPPSKNELKKMHARLSNTLKSLQNTALQCTSFQQAFNTFEKKFNSLNKELMNTFSTSQDYCQHICSLENFYSEKLGFFSPRKFKNLKDRIFNCQMQHHKILEDKKELISHNIDPNHLDKLLKLETHDEPQKSVN